MPYSSIPGLIEGLNPSQTLSPTTLTLDANDLDAIFNSYSNPDYASCCYEPDFAQELAALVQACQSNTSTTTLDLTVDGRHGGRDWSLLETLIRHLPSAHALTLRLTDGSTEDSTEWRLLRLLRRAVRFDTLVLDWGEMEDFLEPTFMLSGRARALDEIQHHAHLTSFSCNTYHESSLGFIAQALLTVPRLASVTLEGRIVVDRPHEEWHVTAVRDFVSKPSLTTLSIHELWLQEPTQCRAFCQGLMESTSLCDLNLKVVCSLEPEALLLEQALQRHGEPHRGYTRFALSEAGNCSDPSERPLVISPAMLLHTHLQLTALQLCGSPMDERAVEELSFALRHSSSLTHLTLIMNGLTNDSLDVLLPGLIQASSLQSLILTQRDVTPPAYLSFVTTLLEQMALQEVRIFVKDLPQENEELSVLQAALVQALGRNTTMQHLVLLNLLHEETALMVQTYCRLNRAGRSYLQAQQQGQNSRNAGVAVLSQVSDYLDDLLVHLLENPSLCEHQGII